MKQVIVVRKDLKMSKGKTAAQCCHACLGAYKKANPDKIKAWESEGYAKIILKVDTLEDLKKVEADANKNKIPNYLVTDQGRTELPPSTVTCLGLGPDTNKKIDKVTKNLKLLS